MPGISILPLVTSPYHPTKRVPSLIYPHLFAKILSHSFTDISRQMTVQKGLYPIFVPDSQSFMIVRAGNAYILRTSTRATSKLEFKICANFVQTATLPLFPCKQRRFDKRQKLGRDETCNKLCHSHTHRVIMEEYFY